MHRKARRSTRGQALIVLALVSTVIFGMGALALDTGIGMADRRDLQAYADAAALAGARSYSSASNANYVAMQYALKNLGLTTLPTGCTSSSACPANTYTVGSSNAYDITVCDGSNAAGSCYNGSQTVDVSITHRRSPLIAGIFGFTSVASSGAHESAGSSGRALAPGPTSAPATYALASLGGDAGVDGGGTSLPSGDVSGLVFTASTFGGNDGPHTVQMPQYVSGITSSGAAGTCASPGVANRVDTSSAGWSGKPYYQVGSGGANGATLTNQSAPSTFGGLQPAVGTSHFYHLTDAGITDNNGNYNPGIYDGIIPPNNAHLHPGVFQIVNLTGGGVDMTGWSNIATDVTAAGSEDTNGAVAIVVDHTDGGTAGTITLNNTVLNGLDATTSTQDKEGTHNFVIYGEDFTGSLSIPQNQPTIMSGIVDLPHSAAGSNGNPTFHFYGAVYVASLSIGGGGNGSQTFEYVCGLQAYAGTGGSETLVR
jgi:Flp pilus assembly protein TadG